MKFKNAIVSVAWLKSNLHLKSLIILDASITPVGNHSNKPSLQELIPGSLFFDLKTVFSDTNSKFPSTVPTPEQFETGAKELGIHQDSQIVVYDTIGVYSSPRAWWLFKLMGFQNVAVLNGGLPAWKLSMLKVDNVYGQASDIGNFKVNFQKNLLVNFEAVLKISLDDSSTIIDARPSNRFNGLKPEPRKGLRSGTIPNSINIPYAEVLNGYELKDEASLQVLFNSKVNINKQLIFSCGSGITACILALAFDISGYKDYSIYDGSWTEFGTLSE